MGLTEIQVEAGGVEVTKIKNKKSLKKYQKKNKFNRKRENKYKKFANQKRDPVQAHFDTFMRLPKTINFTLDNRLLAQQQTFN